MYVWGENVESGQAWATRMSSGPMLSSVLDGQKHTVALTADGLMYALSENIEGGQS